MGLGNGLAAPILSSRHARHKETSSSSFIPNGIRAGGDFRLNTIDPEEGKMKLLRIAAIAALTAYASMAGAAKAAPAAGFLPERRRCGPWQRQRPKPRSKKLIIIAGTGGIAGTDGIAGTGGIIGTRITTAIIGIPTAIIITGVTIGILITTAATTGIGIIGNRPG